MNSILSINNITLKYGKNEVFKEVSFQIEHGDYIGLVGPNGSGKTSLVKSILGLLPPSSGEIIFNEALCPKGHVGYLPQKVVSTDQLFPAQVKEVVATGLVQQKKNVWLTKKDYLLVDDILERLKISDLKNNKIGNLSGGQQQRVLLARAMVSSPQMLILDEPTSALDPRTRESFYELLQELNTRDKVTILLISHDVSSIGKYTKRMLYLDRKIVFYGTYDEFCSSDEMTEYFGFFAQHQFCWRHNDGTCNHPSNHTDC